MPQTYEITAPNGKTLAITGDHVPNEAELQQIFAAAGVSTKAAPTPLPETRMPAGVPARGRGTQLNPDQSWRGVELATTPLAHPTGVDAIDGMTSPLGIASLAAGGVGIARAGVTGGAMAAAKTAVADAAPLVKYEATKTILEKMGVPSSMATVAAMAVSGYKRGAKLPEGVAGDVPLPKDLNAPHLDVSKPVKVSDLTPEQLGERIVYGKGTPSAVAPSGQQIPENLRRPSNVTPSAPIAEPVASAPAVPASPAAPSAAESAPARPAQSAPTSAVKPSLTVDESRLFVTLKKKGLPDAEVWQALANARALRARLGTATGEEVRRAVAHRNETGQW